MRQHCASRLDTPRCTSYPEFEYERDLRQECPVARPKAALLIRRHCARTIMRTICIASMLPHISKFNYDYMPTRCSSLYQALYYPSPSLPAHTSVSRHGFRCKRQTRK
jgi:hypothetical protein